MRHESTPSSTPSSGPSLPASVLGSLLDHHGLAAVLVRDGVVRWANRVALDSVRHQSQGESQGDVEETPGELARVARALTIKGDMTGLSDGDERQVDVEFSANHALVTARASLVGIDDAEGVLALVTFPAGRSGVDASSHVERLEAMLAATADIISVIDTDGRVRYSNGAAGRVTGIEGFEANGASMLEFVHPDDAEVASEAFTRGILQGEQIDPVELRLRFADEQWHDVEAEITSPITVDDSECYVVTIRDISERLRRQREQAASHRRLESLVEDIEDVIVLLGPDLSVLYTSPSIERLIDAPAYTNVGENAFNDMHPDDVPGVLAAIEEASEAEGKRSRADLRLRHERFGWRWIEASVVNRLEDPAVGGYVCTLRDVTEQRDADAELRRLREQDRDEMARLREADRLKDDFLTTVSHELRTPLTSVRGFSTLLQTQTGLDDATRASLIDRIVANAQEMEGMVEQLLDFSRLQAGRVRVEVQSLEVGPLLNDLVDRLSHPLSEHSVSIEAGGETVKADRRAFDHVVGNLLTNAARYSEAGTHISVVVSRRDDEIDIDVIDQGMGIAPEDHARVFRSFYQAAPGSPGRRGVGVGLNIARRYAQLQSGHLRLVSEVGGGSTFTFTLPAGN